MELNHVDKWIENDKNINFCYFLKTFIPLIIYIYVYNVVCKNAFFLIKFSFNHTFRMSASQETRFLHMQKQRRRSASR